jgi:pseudo-rSAM protein
MPDKSYWFYLESFVYALVKGDNLLLYNTLTGKYLAYHDQPRLVQFIRDLAREENLYALKVTREFLKDNGLQDFTGDVLNHFMGDLIDRSLTGKKPFIMPPRFDIREETGDRQRRTFRNVSRESILGLNQLTLGVNSRCGHNCNVCAGAYKQFPWCTREKEESQLSLTDIETVLEQTRGCPIKTIDITGGDLTQYPHLNRLVELLRPGSFNVNYCFHLFHLKNGLPGALQAGGPRTRITLLAECSTLSLPGDLDSLKQLKPDKLVFLIQRNEEMPILEEVIEKLNAANISVQPYFNGRNLDFFKENVFTDHEALAENILDMGAISSRKAYNTLNYGHMFIASDKSIYSNLNGPALGKIGETTMDAAVISELSEYGNWLRVRRDAAPCKDCLFDSLCPPLSDFEYASGINNSCNIWKNQRTNP